MITFSKLNETGRLGNQMFNIATAIGYAEKYNEKLILPKWKYAEYFDNDLDYSYKDYTYRIIYEGKGTDYVEIPHYQNIELQGCFISGKYGT